MRPVVARAEKSFQLLSGRLHSKNDFSKFTHCSRKLRDQLLLGGGQKFFALCVDV
jgi:hypothetical protein